MKIVLQDHEIILFSLSLILAIIYDLFELLISVRCIVKLEKN